MSTSPRIALVTGAGSGIGRAVAVALLAEGYHVALAGRRAEPLAETAAIAAAGDRALALPTDVTSPDAVDALFARVRDTWGRLDLLFNNAGASAGAAFEDLSYERWKAIVDVNLTGMFLCAQGAFRLMKAQQPQGGRIVNNGSISAMSPRPDSAAYVATKHGVSGLTKSLALDGRACRIACGQIDIGNAVTPLTEKMAAGVKQADGRLAPEPRMDVEHVARAVVFMASLPLDTNVLSMTIMATAMPFVGRG
jgi:NAD(P)-dependent dehydrogenase (short-subunit alcohol dehydrogenase family)